jgi:hypothetical protein
MLEIMGIVQKVEIRMYELEIEMNDELDDKLNCEFEIKECVNFKVNLNTKFSQSK